MPQSAIDADYSILGQEAGFPDLPVTKLILAVRSRKVIYREFSEYLVRSCKISVLGSSAIIHKG